MKLIEVVAIILLFPMMANAEDYQPLEEDFQSFKGHYLYPLLQEAIHSDSINKAITNWKAVAEEAGAGTDTLTDSPLVDDITQYEIYRSALKELIRLNYLSGNNAEGDKWLRQLDSTTLIERPTGRYLRSICEKECKK